MYSSLLEYHSWNTVVSVSEPSVKEHYREERHLQKKIIHIRPTFQASPKWNAYDSIVTESSALKLVQATYALILDSSDWSNLSFCTNTVIYTNQPNLSSLFPNHTIKSIQFLTSSTDVDRIIYDICSHLAYRTIYWTFPRYDFANQISMTAKASDVIPPLVLIQNYYHPSDAQRREEIDYCVVKNCENPLLDQLILITETDKIELPIKNSKIVTYNLGKRMSFKNVYDYIQKNINLGTICAYGNSDMYLGNMRLLFHMNLSKTFLALLRWEINWETKEVALYSGKDGIPIKCSQDIWVVLSDDVYKMDFSKFPVDFYFGRPTCDNVIVTIMKQYGFACLNPSYSLQTFHVHKEESRPYDWERDRILNIDYTFVSPIQIY